MLMQLVSMNLTQNKLVGTLPEEWNNLTKVSHYRVIIPMLIM